MFIARNQITFQEAISDCSETAIQSHPFPNISPKNTDGTEILLVNYRLTVQSSSFILKWLHQECFLGNLPKASRVPENFPKNNHRL